MMNEVDIINYDFVVLEQKLDDIYSVLNDLMIHSYDIYESFNEFNKALDDLEISLIVIIIMLGIIAGACIFRHLRK